MGGEEEGPPNIEDGDAKFSPPRKRSFSSEKGDLIFELERPTFSGKELNLIN